LLHQDKFNGYVQIRDVDILVGRGGHSRKKTGNVLGSVRLRCGLSFGRSEPPVQAQRQILRLLSGALCRHSVKHAACEASINSRGV